MEEAREVAGQVGDGVEADADGDADCNHLFEKKKKKNDADRG